MLRRQCWNTNCIVLKVALLLADIRKARSNVSSENPLSKGLRSTKILWLTKVYHSTKTLWLTNVYHSTKILWLTNVYRSTKTLWLTKVYHSTKTLWLTKVYHSTKTLWLTKVYHSTKTLNETLDFAFRVSAVHQSCFIFRYSYGWPLTIFSRVRITSIKVV